MLALGGDTLRVGGINAQGDLEWMDFKSNPVCNPLISEPIRIKLFLDFTPTALHFLNAKQVLLAGHRHQDTLAWAILNTDIAKVVQQGILPDSVRKGQINAVRRLRNGDMLFAGKKYGDLLLIRTNAGGKVTHVLNQFKELKDEILDLFESESGHIYASGYLKDNTSNEKLMYILFIKNDLKVDSFKMIGESDVINIAYSTVVSPTQLPVIAGVEGLQWVILWLDSAQEIERKWVLPNTIRFKNLRIEPVQGNRYRVWATDTLDTLHLFLIDK